MFARKSLSCCGNRIETLSGGWRERDDSTPSHGTVHALTLCWAFPPSQAPSLQFFSLHQRTRMMQSSLCSSLVLKTCPVYHLWQAWGLLSYQWLVTGFYSNDQNAFSEGSFGGKCPVLSPLSFCTARATKSRASWHSVPWMEPYSIIKPACAMKGHMLRESLTHLAGPKAATVFLQGRKPDHPRVVSGEMPLTWTVAN